MAIGTTSVLAVGAASVAIYQRVVNGQPVAQSLENAVNTARQGVASAVGVVNPLYRNGPRATPEQRQRWIEKVHRTQGSRGINEVARVMTSPYISPTRPNDLRGFATFAGEGTGTGIRGGTVLAVLLSIETNAGISSRAACWNNNFGNFKLFSAQWHAEQTPPCYFLVDRVPSLDYYPSFDNAADGVRAWSNATFGNSRYNSHGTMDALRAGDIRAFTRAIGDCGYARMYHNPRSMDARARRLASLGVIDLSNLTFNEAIPSRVAV